MECNFHLQQLCGVRGSDPVRLALRNRLFSENYKNAPKSLTNDGMATLHILRGLRLQALLADEHGRENEATDDPDLAELRRAVRVKGFDIGLIPQLRRARAFLEAEREADQPVVDLTLPHTRQLKTRCSVDSGGCGFIADSAVIAGLCIECMDKKRKTEAAKARAGKGKGKVKDKVKRKT
jgi:hypothetical protein